MFIQEALRVPPPPAKHRLFKGIHSCWSFNNFRNYWHCCRYDNADINHKLSKKETATRLKYAYSVIAEAVKMSEIDSGPWKIG